MNKRQFLAAAIGSASLPAFSVSASTSRQNVGPSLLTVTGAVVPNRGPFDPALDQMMHKQRIKFDRAHAFDFAMLAALPSVAIKPTLEQDAKPHALRGPLLLDVVKAAGAKLTDATSLLLRAVDGYAVVITSADMHKYRFIVATHLDGLAMPLGGLGPLWAMYEADHFPDMAAKALNERFGSCPWALYHIEVQS